MNTFNTLVANALRSLADRIDSGNCNIDKDAAEQITDCINRCTNQEQLLSTDETIKYLNVSRSQFYTKIKDYLSGIKKPGHTTIYYTKKVLDEYKHKINNEKW